MQKVTTNDGTLTLKSEKYNECYHSSEGAVTETLYKHIYPAFSVVDKDEIKILDICFGLGYNTFLSILNRGDKKLKIYSPEFDEELVKSLKKFDYPKEFEKFKPVCKTNQLQDCKKEEVVNGYDNTILYTDYIHLFQISGMILLVAMIGAITLTFSKRENIKRQSYFNQIQREKDSAVKLAESNLKIHYKKILQKRKRN